MRKAAPYILLGIGFQPYVVKHFQKIELINMVNPEPYLALHGGPVQALQHRKNAHI
jgi:hypothetical protein